MLSALTAVCLSFAACDTLDDLTGLDGLGDPIQFSREITLGDLEQTLTDGAARVEIELLHDGLIARRVVVRDVEAQAEPERIESLVLDVDAGESAGVLFLAIDGLQVAFDGETAFRTGGGHELSLGGFVEHVQAILNDGFEPRIKAKRHPPAEPQAPTVATFRAAELTLVEAIEAPLIEVNVGAGHLALNLDPQPGEPDGWINVLGLTIELRVSDGITDLGTEDVDITDAVEFEGHVASVNLDLGTFSFSDGTTVEITDATQIFEADSDIPLTSLAAVKAALDDGFDVVAWGGGELASTEPRVIVALELRFAVHANDHPETVEFEGCVTAVNLDLGSFTLTNGTVVRVVDATELVDHGEGESLMSLQAVWEALAAGREVVAYGAAEVESTEPLTLVALEMRFVLQPPPTESFEGHVATVNVEQAFFTLTNGIVVHLTADSEILQPEQGEGLTSLAAAKDALDNGFTVVAWGNGEVESTEPLTLVAHQVYLVLSN